MKNILIPLFVLACAIACETAENPTKNIRSDQHEPEDNELQVTTPRYDSLLAQQLEADDYGMKMYVMAFLKRGPNRNRDSTEAAKLQRAHLDNIIRLAEEGKLITAGPFGDDGNIRGIYIFNVSSVEEARLLTETDPAIQAGSLELELRPWYGPAALQMINDWSKKITKKEI